MIKATKTLALVLLSGLVFTAFQSTTDSHVSRPIVSGEVGVRLDEYLTRITPFGFAGTVLVANGGSVVLNKGYGLANRAEGLPNTAETVFSTGSITKQFTAAGIMKLEDEGRLATTDLASRYLDAVPPDKSGITLHHLLTHTAGITVSSGPDYEAINRDEAVKTIIDAPLRFAPGTKFEYTNTGYTLLAAIIEKVSGQPYEQFLREQLFRPAGMTSTGYRLPDWSKKVVAHWYRWDIDSGTPLEKLYPFWNLIGNGGILSTTADMYRWHLALTGDAVLSAGAREKLYTPFLGNYAYGWDVRETDRGALIEHNGGSMLGNSAEFVRYVDADITIVLFANQSYGRFPLSAMVKDKIVDIAFGDDVALPPSELHPELPLSKAFKGTYDLSTGGVFRVSEEGGRLALAAERQDTINLLTAPDEATLALYRELNERSEAILQAAVIGDYEPLAGALEKSEERLYPTRRFLETLVRRSETITGGIRRVEALGSIRSPVDERVTRTMLRFEGELGSFHLSIVWLKGKVGGMRPEETGASITVPFLAVAEAEFAGYHLGLPQNINLSFDLSDLGSVTELVVSGESGSAHARARLLVHHAECSYPDRVNPGDKS